MVTWKISTIEWANLIVGVVGAVGTIVALVVAIILGLHESRRFRAEAAERDADRRAEREAQERAQAERVSAIARVDREPAQRYSLGNGQLNDEEVHYAYADVLNSSAQPIYDVKVLFPRGRGLAVIEVGFVPGGGTGHVHLPPQSDASLEGAPLEVAFRDAAERWWSRCADGHLQACEGDPYPRPEHAAGEHHHG